MALSFRKYVWLLLFPLTAVAQSAEDSLAVIPPSASIPGTIDVYFFPAFPMGDFGADSGPNPALAQMGIGLGIEYVFPIGKTPLGWVTGAAIAINPVDEDKAAILL